MKGGGFGCWQCSLTVIDKLEASCSKWRYAWGFRKLASRPTIDPVSRCANDAWAATARELRHPSAS